MRTFRSAIITVLGLLVLSFPCHAQLQDLSPVLSGFSPELYTKIQTLALFLDQGLKTGQITEADLQQGLLSGELDTKLRALHPEAGRLLDEISEGIKTGHGPAGDSLLPLLGGLGGTPP